MNRKKSRVYFAFYFLIVLPSVTYALVLWDSCKKTFFGEQEKIHVRAAKVIFGLNSGTQVLDYSNWFSLNNLYDRKLLLLAHKFFVSYVFFFFFLTKLLPKLFRNFWKSTTAVITYEESLRLRYLFPKTKLLSKSSCYKAQTLWNSLESHTEELLSFESFKRTLKSQLF